MVLGSLGLVAGSLVPKFGPEGPTFGSLVPRVVEVDRVVEVIRVIEVIRVVEGVSVVEGVKVVVVIRVGEVIRMVRVGEVYLDGGESDCPF